MLIAVNGYCAVTDSDYDHTQDNDCQLAWLFTGGSGTSVADSSTNSHTGSFKGSGEPAWDTDDVPFGTEGSAPNSVHFDGSDDEISTADSADFNIGTGDATWYVFFERDTDATWHNLLSHTNPGDASEGWWITMEPDTTYGNSILIAIDDSDHNSDDGIPDPADGWVSLCVTKVGTNITYYANGVESGGANNSKNIDDSSQPFKMGNQNSAYGESLLDGSIAEAALFTRALSPAEITKIYNYGLAGYTAPATSTGQIIMVTE